MTSFGSARQDGAACASCVKASRHCPRIGSPMAPGPSGAARCAGHTADFGKLRGRLLKQPPDNLSLARNAGRAPVPTSIIMIGVISNCRQKQLPDPQSHFRIVRGACRGKRAEVIVLPAGEFKLAAQGSFGVAVLLNIGKCLMPKFLFRRGRFHGSHRAVQDEVEAPVAVAVLMGVSRWYGLPDGGQAGRLMILLQPGNVGKDQCRSGRGRGRLV
jgi:hypothetical protein